MERVLFDDLEYNSEWDRYAKRSIDGLDIRKACSCLVAEFRDFSDIKPNMRGF